MSGIATAYLSPPAISTTGPSTFEMMFRSTTPGRYVCSWILTDVRSLAVVTLITGALGVQIRNETSGLIASTATVKSLATVTDGRWHHLGVTHPSNAPATASIYLDGAPIGTVTVESGDTFAEMPYIGARITVTVVTPTTPTYRSVPVPGFVGSVANIAVFDVVLTSTKIADHARLARQLNYDRLLTGQLIEAVLQVAGWPTTMYEIDPGNTVCQPLATAIASSSFEETTYATTGSALGLTAAFDVITMAQQTEWGLFFQKPTGILRFVNRQYFQTTGTRAPSYNFNDDGTSLGVPFRPNSKILQDDLDLWNATQVQRDNGLLQTWVDAQYSSRFGLMMYEGLTDLLQESDTDSMALAQFIVRQFRAPTERVAELKLASFVTGGAEIPSMLGAGIWDAVRVTASKRVGRSSPFEQNSVVEGYTHTFYPTRWEASLALSPFELVIDFWFALDTTTATHGDLDTARLAY